MTAETFTVNVVCLFLWGLAISMKNSVGHISEHFGLVLANKVRRSWKTSVTWKQSSRISYLVSLFRMIIH